MRIKYGKEREEREIDLPPNASGRDLWQVIGEEKSLPPLALRVEGKLRDLATPLSEGERVSFVDFSSREGKEIFWHTSAHLLAQAVMRLWPEAKPTIGPAIEEGFYYDFANLSLSEEDLPRIEREMEAIVKEGHRPERALFSGKEEALQAFANNPFKQELIEGLGEGEGITAYRQGEFFDLCRGPHLPQLRPLKGIKLLKTSGAYWRGDAKRPMLTRIYGITFPSREELREYLLRREEAKKRDHRLLGAQLDLFSFHEEAPGIPFFHPRGVLLWDQLLGYWKELHRRAGYHLIQTPQLLSQGLWERSGHWEHYRENMFTVGGEEGRSYALKPMNCPGCILYFQSKSHSYRELPLRLAEVGHVHRREPSGAWNGLFRVQSFHQDDAHLFLDLSHLQEEMGGVLSLVRELYGTFGLAYGFELSTRPKESIGSDEQWESATSALHRALEEFTPSYEVNEGEGAFYGPKIDLHVRDALGRRWQCGTIQLDMALPEKFSLHYKNREGEKSCPLMVHRAIFGSIERFLGIIIEHFGGKFPLWLSPCPIRIFPIAPPHESYARRVAERVAKEGVVVEVEESDLSLKKRVRQGQLDQVNYMVTVGDQEEREGTLSLRTRGGKIIRGLSVESFCQKMGEEYRGRALLSPYEGEQGEG